MHAVRVTVFSDELLRVEYAPQGRFADDPSLFAIRAPLGRSVRTTSARAGAGELIVETPRARFEYTPDGKPPHAGNMRALVRHVAVPAGVPTHNGRVVWTPGSKNLHNLGGALETLDFVRSAVPLPDGVLARDGWALIDDSQTHHLVDDWVVSRESRGLGGNTDWYLFVYGEDYPAALRSLAAIAGKVPLPRRCTLGSWYSRYWPHSSAEYRGIMLDYRAHGFPLDVLVLDMDWHKDGWTGWSWNRELLPDAEDLIAHAHEHGVAVTLNLHPADGVGPHEDRYAAFMRALGKAPSGERVPFDSADRTYMRALFDQVHRPLEHPEGRPDSGVDFWWLDWQQDRHTRSMPGLSNLRWLNVQYFRHTSQERSRRGQSFSRWGGWGDHRHPIHFSGDAHTGWKSLAFQVPFTVQSAGSGCFFWSHDIGGHFGPRNEEATTRWVQFGAFSAALRLHSARSGALDRRPWTYQGRFAHAMKLAFELRCGLMPTIYTAARTCHDQSLPLLRGMYMSCSCDERAYQTPGQYLLGDDLLVAPIVSPGMGDGCVATQRVWFPCGCEQGTRDRWFDLSTAESHEGGDEVIVAAGIEHVPVYVRGGTPLFMQPVGHRMSGTITHLIVRLFPGTIDSTLARELYEDDGVSAGYLDGEHARTPVSARWSRTNDDRTGLNLLIGPTVGTYADQPQQRALSVELSGIVCVTSARMNGVPVSVEIDRDRAGGTATLRAPGEISIRDSVRVELEFEEASSPSIAERFRRDHLHAALGTASAGAGGVLRHAVVNACLQAPDAKTQAAALAIGGGIALTKADGHYRLVDSFGLIDDAVARVLVIDQIGSERREVDRLDLALSPLDVSRPRAASVPVPAKPLPEAALGVRAARLLRVEFSIDRTPLSFEAEVRTALPGLRGWMLCAPFDWDWRWQIHDRSHGPEHGPRPRIDANYTGADARYVAWHPASFGEKWPVDFSRISPERGGVGYAWAAVRSPLEQDARVWFEAAGDKSQVFVNGVEVYRHNAWDAAVPEQDWFACRLSAGRNDLLVKSAEGGGGWGFALTLECERAVEEIEVGLPSGPDVPALSA